MLMTDVKLLLRNFTQITGMETAPRKVYAEKKKKSIQVR